MLQAGSWTVNSQSKLLHQSWFTASSFQIHPTEIYIQVKWTGCKAITVKWIQLHLFVTLILEIWFSLDECQMELDPPFILCDITWPITVSLRQLLFPTDDGLLISHNNQDTGRKRFPSGTGLRTLNWNKPEWCVWSQSWYKKNTGHNENTIIKPHSFFSSPCPSQ